MSVDSNIGNFEALWFVQMEDDHTLQGLNVLVLLEIDNEGLFCLQIDIKSVTHGGMRRRIDRVRNGIKEKLLEVEKMEENEREKKASFSPSFILSGQKGALLGLCACT